MMSHPLARVGFFRARWIGFASRNVQVLRRIMRRFAAVNFSSVFCGQIDSGCRGK